MTRNIFYVFLVLVAGCEPMQETSVSMGTLEVDQVSVVADSSEPLLEIAVVEGDKVAPGQLIAKQDDTRARAALRAAQAELAIVSAKLAEAEAGPRAQDIAAARAQVAAAESNARTLRIELERERSLVKQNYASQNQVDVLEGRYEAAIARKQETEAILAQLLEGTRSEEIDAARSSYAMTQARLDDIQITLDRTLIASPVEGTVESVIYEVGERPGAGSVVANILLTQVPYARIHVPEPLRTRLAIGAPAEIHIDGHERAYQGRLRWIAQDASFTPYFSLTQHDRSHLSYLAEVDLIDPAGPNIATGVPVAVHFPGIDSP